MIDHIGFRVTDIAAARSFYMAALAPLDIHLLVEVTDTMTGGHGAHLGFGRDSRPFFWVGTGGAAVSGVHVAFTAHDRATVDAFHAAALRAGGRDNGAPGLRPQYHPGYYGAFALDADGNNIEAVFHDTGSSGGGT